MIDNQKISDIAKNILNIETLKEQKSDDKDFHDLPVWSIEKALKAAYEAGKKSS